MKFLEYHRWFMIHSADYVRGAIGEAGLALVELTRASSRMENRVPVPGLLVVARR